MKPHNRERLLDAVHRWTGEPVGFTNERPNRNDRLIAVVEDIMLDELKQLPGDLVHEAVDRGLNAIAERFLSKTGKGKPR